MKNSKDIIGNRTRDLPACGAMPQPTAPPHAPSLLEYTRLYIYIYIYIYIFYFRGKSLSTFLATLFLLKLAVNSFTVRCLTLHGHAHIAEKIVSSSADLLEEQACLHFGDKWGG